MSHSDEMKIKEVITERIWKICREYGDIFNIILDYSGDTYHVTITCGFPGLAFEDIDLYIKDSNSIRLFHPSEKRRIRKMSHETRMIYKSLEIPDLQGIPLTSLRHNSLYSSIDHRLKIKCYTELLKSRRDYIRKLIDRRRLVLDFLNQDILAITDILNAIMVKNKFKLGDIIKKRVIERAIGIYCLILESYETIKLKRKKVYFEIPNICAKYKKFVEKDDKEIFALENETFEDVLEKLIFRAKIRWIRKKTRKWGIS